MRVIEPHEFKGVKHPKKKRSRIRVAILLPILVVAGYTASVLLTPVAAITAETKELPSLQSSASAIQWPAYGQASIGAVGFGTLGTHNEQEALPTASVIKVMTALAVLKQKPLQKGEQGPVLTMTQADVDEYNKTLALGGSNVPVTVGEQITQYQALQAVLLPSSNNMAHSLVRWAYGSDEKYVEFVNKFARSLGMKDTYIDDASGFSLKTVSTAEDLAKLAVNAMDNPVIAEIAKQQVATIPVAGQIYSTNMLLGRNNIVGIKTGLTDEAGGCFMAAATREIGGITVTAVSVIMGAPDKATALRDSIPLITSVLDGFEARTVVSAGQVVGSYKTSGSSVNAVVQKDLSGPVWKASPSTTVVQLDSINTPRSKGDETGTVTAQFGRDKNQVPVFLDGDIKTASLTTRFVPFL